MIDANLELKFHHIGVACHSIQQERLSWEMLGYQQEGNEFQDRIQGVTGLFMIGQGGPRVELLEPLAGAKTLEPFLKNGIKMYHQAYETKRIEETIQLLKIRRAIILSDVKPAIAFQNRQVAFLMLKNRLIIELIESAKS